MKKILSHIAQNKNRIIYNLFAFESLIPFMMLSVVVWYISYSYHFTITYNDAMSHLNISRSVFDNLEPGLAQLGGVWLPFTHILPLIFVWNDWAWRSGFAGSFFSMVAYVISVWAIFRTLLLLTNKQLASMIGALIFAFNLNMLYLQTTPMTEPVYIGLFCLSLFVFTKYLLSKDNTKYLLILGIIGFLQVLTRYDGWFVFIIQLVLIAIHERFVLKKAFNEMFGKVFLFGTLVAFGIGLWLIWNLLIFKDPFFFAFGQFSAHSQQSVYELQGALITKGNIITSIATYGHAVLHNVGIYITFLSFIAVGFVFLKKKISISWSRTSLIIIFLFSPILFNILALFLGFSIIFTPPISFQQPLEGQGPWFNIRYGLLALPLAAFSIGLLVSRSKLALVITCLLLILQTHYFYTYGIASLIDGTKGLSAFYAADISHALGARIKSEDKVLMPLYSFNQVAFKSGINLNQVVHEGVSKQWTKALQHPEEYAEWVVMANTASDPIYKSLILERKKAFLAKYEHVYTGNNASIYKLKNKH